MARIEIRLSLFIFYILNCVYEYIDSDYNVYEIT